MDVLNDILDTLNLKGVLYFRTDLSSPWAVKVPDLEQAARFHLVIQGNCHVQFSSGVSVDLQPGDLVLIPKGRSHILSDGTTQQAPALETLLNTVGYDGNGELVVGDGAPNATTQMVCGHFNFRSGSDHPLLRALPEYLLTPASVRARQPWLDEVLRLITRRIFSDEAGSATAVTRLSEIVFIELLRHGIGESSALRAILEAFQDRYISRSLQLIHSQPEQPWTVESLASEVCMSRSRFADRFKTLLGSGPMSYLSDWRLQKALALLDDAHCSVKQIASQTGYQSPAAFTRAFSGRFGISPTEYRRKLG